MTSHGRFINLKEKRIQGWPERTNPGELSAREFGLALGNSWPIPVSTRIVWEIGRAMGRRVAGKDPIA